MVRLLCDGAGRQNPTCTAAAAIACYGAKYPEMSRISCVSAEA